MIDRCFLTIKKIMGNLKSKMKWHLSSKMGAISKKMTSLLKYMICNEFSRENMEFLVRFVWGVHNGIVGVYCMNTCGKLFLFAKFCFFSLGRDGARRGATGRNGARWGATGILGVYCMNTCGKLFLFAKFCFFSPGCDGARRGATGRDGAQFSSSHL